MIIFFDKSTGAALVAASNPAKAQKENQSALLRMTPRVSKAGTGDGVTVGVDGNMMMREEPV
jgi:hypothetical protein